MKEKPWPLKRVGLRVGDSESMEKFYTHLGLTKIRDGKNTLGEKETGFGSPGHEVLTLREVENGHPRPHGSSGLYHFALLLPSQQELGSFFRYAINNQIELDGAADHFVSEALYLTDPEGNGIEIYADRPESEWKRQDNQIIMGSAHLNTENLLRQAHQFSHMSEDMFLGHMHLQVGDLQTSTAFYKTLGLNITADFANQARFLSWNNYHHHLGINIWAGRNTTNVENNTFGLDFFELHNPNLTETSFTDIDGISVLNAI